MRLRCDLDETINYSIACTQMSTRGPQSPHASRPYTTSGYAATPSQNQFEYDLAYESDGSWKEMPTPSSYDSRTTQASKWVKKRVQRASQWMQRVSRWLGDTR